MSEQYNRFLTWLNERNLVGLRSIIVYSALYFTYLALDWSFEFAMGSKYDALGTAAVMGAVTAPLTILLREVVRLYVDSKEYDK